LVYESARGYFCKRSGFCHDLSRPRIRSDGLIKQLTWPQSPVSFDP